MEKSYMRLLINQKFKRLIDKFVILLIPMNYLPRTFNYFQIQHVMFSKVIIWKIHLYNSTA